MQYRPKTASTADSAAPSGATSSTPLVTLTAPSFKKKGGQAPGVEQPEPITSIKQRAQSAPRERPPPSESSEPAAPAAWAAGVPLTVRRGVRGGRGGAAGPANRGDRPDNLESQSPLEITPAVTPVAGAPAPAPAAARPPHGPSGPSLAARLLPHMAAARPSSTSPTANGTPGAAAHAQITVQFARPALSSTSSPQWSPGDPASPAAGAAGVLRPPARAAGGATSPGAANFLLAPHAMNASSLQPSPGSLTPRSADGAASTDGTHGANQARRAKDQAQLEARLASITSDALRAEVDCLRAELSYVRDQLASKSSELLHVLRSGLVGGADGAHASDGPANAARIRTLEAELKDREAKVVLLEEQVMSLRMSSQVLSAEVNRLRAENLRLRESPASAAPSPSPAASPAPLAVVASPNVVEVPHAALEELEELRRDLALERSLREAAQSEHQKCADLAHKYVVLRDQVIKSEESRMRMRRELEQLRGRSPRRPQRPQGGAPGDAPAGRPQAAGDREQQRTAGRPPRGGPSPGGDPKARDPDARRPQQRSPGPDIGPPPGYEKKSSESPSKTAGAGAAPGASASASSSKPAEKKAPERRQEAVIAVFQSREMEKLPRNIKDVLSSGFAGHARPYIFNFASLDELQRQAGAAASSGAAGEGKQAPLAALLVGHAYSDSKIEPVDKRALENLRKAGVKHVALLVMRKSEDPSKVKDPPQSAVESGFGDKRFVLKLVYSGDKDVVHDSEENRQAMKTLLEAADAIFPKGH